MSFQDKSNEQEQQNRVEFDSPRRSQHKRRGDDQLSPQELIDRVQRMLDQGHAKQAFDLINARGAGDASVRNARAVCQLRLGKADEAVRLLREIVLPHGRVDLRTDVPVCFKTNYATALFLSGNVSGGETVLHDLRGAKHPRLADLHRALDGWVASLSYWQRFLRRCGLPLDKPFSIDFAPGDLS